MSALGGLLLGGTGGNTPGTATAAGGTHHTGMHSCYLCFEYFVCCVTISSGGSKRAPPEGWRPVLWGILDPPLISVSQSFQ